MGVVRTAGLHLNRIVDRYPSVIKAVIPIRVSGDSFVLIRQRVTWCFIV